MLTAAVTARRRPRSEAAVRERGSASIQMLFLLPALFSIMFLGMQAALYYQARTLAIAAAQEGARVAGAENSSSAAGIASAASFVADAGDVLTAAQVSGDRSAETATVTVRGTSLSVIPGWTPTVAQSASVPVERITG